MTETAQLLLSGAAAIVSLSVLLIGVCSAVFIGVKLFPYAYWYFKSRKVEGKNYVHPDTGKPVTADEALSAEESMFSGDVALASWSEAVTRHRH